jgi:hypothetical protein
MTEGTKRPLALPTQPGAGPFGGLDNAIAVAHRIPPQVLLIYNGIKKAYGREKLKELGFNVGLLRHASPYHVVQEICHRLSRRYLE